MNLGTIGQATGLFAITNIDDLLVLALFFARGEARKVVIGQYLGFAAILAVAVAAAFGATLLPESAIRYLGLLPLALGIRAAAQAWRHRGDPEDETQSRAGGPTILEVAAVTLANGGDNIGVYVPVFATAGPGAMTVYVIVFLVLLAAWLAAGRYLARRPLIAEALSRWGHILLPVVLIGLGVLILVEG